MRINEPLSSNIAALKSREGGTSNVLVSSLTNITQFLNEAQNDLARQYYPIQDSITYTWPSGDQYAAYAALTCVANSNNVCHGVRRLYWDGTLIFYCDRAAAENWDSTQLADSNGNPLYWYDDGIEGIGLSVPASSSKTLTGRVIVIPAPLVSTDDVPIFPLDLHRLLSYYAASMVLARIENKGEMAAKMMSMYNDGAQAMLDLLWRRDPDLVNDLLRRNAQPQTNEPQTVN